MVFVLPADEAVLEALRDLPHRGSASTSIRRNEPGPGVGRVCLVVDLTLRRPHVVFLCVARGAASFTSVDRLIRFEHLRELEPPMPVEMLAASLTAHHRESLQGALSRQGRAMTSPGSRAVVRALLTVRPDLQPVVAELSDLARRIGSIGGAPGQRLSLQHDAVLQALRLGVFSSRELRSWHTDDLDRPYLAGLLAASPEASLLNVDATRFPGMRPYASSEPHVYVFTDGERRLEVMNVNATGPEGVLGADLIYFIARSSSLVFLQYKRMTEGAVRVDERFRSQLDRLKSIGVRQTPGYAAIDWRLDSVGPAFVKLAEPGDFDPSSDRLLPGMYLPVPYVDRLLADPATEGPGGGRTLGYRTVDRYWTATLFASLVVEGWIGSSGLTVPDLLDMAAQSLNAEHDAIVAVETGELPADLRRRRQRLER